MKYAYHNALIACEETSQVNRDLKTEIDHFKSLVKKETTGDVGDFETVKNEHECLEKELVYKNKEIQEILKQNKNYKGEVKSVNAKHEKVTSEMKSIKEEREILETRNKNLSVSLKSAKLELKEAAKRYDADRKQFEREMESLTEYKVKHDVNLRELKKREKKQAQKVKKEMKKAAELEVDKLKKSKVGNNPNDLAEATLCAEAFVLQPDRTSPTMNLAPSCPVATDDHLASSSFLNTMTTTYSCPPMSSMVYTKPLDATDPSCSLEIAPSLSLDPTDSNLIPTSIVETSFTSLVTTSSLDTSSLKASSLVTPSLDTSSIGCSITNSSNILDLYSCESPNLNPWICVTNRNRNDDTSKDANETKAEEKIREKEGQIREKARKLVENKMQTKFKDLEISENLANELEAEFLEDLEETIQEHLEAYKATLKHETNKD